MSNNRYAARRDSNETRLVRELEQLGFLVQRVNAADWPDLIVIHPRGVAFVEIKTRTGRLSEGQERTIRRILDHGGEAFTARCANDVLRAFGMVD